MVTGVSAHGQGRQANEGKFDRTGKGEFLVCGRRKGPWPLDSWEATEGCQRDSVFSAEAPFS